MLRESIVNFFASYYGRNLSAGEQAAIEYSIESHGIDLNGGWMKELFEALLGNRLNCKTELLHLSYPNGDSGFCNLLLDLQQDSGFDLGDFEDYGEGATWTLPRIGVKLFICREGRPDYYIVQPISTIH